MATTKKAEDTTVAEAQVQLNKIDAETLIVPIRGTAPLIVHNFSEKSRRQMLEAQQGKKKIKEIRDPRAEYEAAFYRIAHEDGTEGYGFPVTAFKAATTGAARFYDKSVTMTALRQFMFMRGVMTKADAQMLVEIHGEPEMREDVVRLGGPSSIDRGSILSLIDAGGMGIGVGEWRPEKRGEFGTYAVDQTKNVEVL